MSITVKRQLTLSEQEECWGSSRTLRVTAAVKEAQVGARPRSVQQHREKSYSVNNMVAQKSIPNCKEGPPGRSQKEQEEHKLTARHKCVLQVQRW